MSVLAFSRTLSVSDATARGVSGLIKGAEAGEDIVVSRHGKAVAAVVSTRHLDAIRHLESDLQDAVLALARAATDSGIRASLDDAITAFGFDRAELGAELGAELDADLAAGRE